MNKHSNKSKIPTPAPALPSDRVKIRYDRHTHEVWTEDGKLFGCGKIVNGNLVFTSTRG